MSLQTALNRARYRHTQATLYHAKAHYIRSGRADYLALVHRLYARLAELAPACNWSQAHA
jgi:hypothetical protein